MRINTNTAAMNTYSNLTSANASKSNSLAKLSSGLRINKAGDDAAGLAISEKMKNQISGLTQASRNAQDGISLIQTAEGGLSETHSILNRMRDLTVQSANGTNTADDKTAIQAELTSLTAEVDRIAGDTKFNTQGLMNATEGITEKSLDATGVKELLLENSYDEVMNNTVVDNTASRRNTKGLAEALSNLSAEKLDTVVAQYNVKVAQTITAVVIPVAHKLTAATDYTVDSSANNAVKLNTASGEKFEDIAANKEVRNKFTDAYNESKGYVDAKDKKTFAEITKEPMSAADFKAANDQYSKNEELRVDKETATQNKEIFDAKINAFDIKQSSSKEFTFQIGANAGEKISVEIKNMSTKGLGITDINVASGEQKTDDILGKLDDAISLVSEQRANLGAVQNRLDHTVSNLATTKENLSEANSRITDVDMAEEMMSFTKSNILSQASTSMLAQANQMPQSVLSLLQ